jgi:glycosyltransferase involved in cell wall biosynthesis
MTTNASSPRILYVTNVWPDQTTFGGALRSLNVLRALQQMGTVEVLLLDDVRENDGRTPESAEPTCVRTVEINARPRKTLIDKICWTLDPRRDYPDGCGVGRADTRRVLHNLGDFDLVWFFKLRSADMFPNSPWQRSVVDIDDVPSTYQRTALHVGPSLERLMALRRLLVWRRRERLLGTRFGVLAVCSEEDRQYLARLGVKAPIHIVPNGYEQPAAEPARNPSTPARIGFIGSLEFPPAREGIGWFLASCWPRIKRALPQARLRLMGRGSDKVSGLCGPDVDGLGQHPEPADEIKTWSVMIVPIRLGSGTRVKIAHGFSQKCPIVSTTLGAYGYGAVNGREMYLADSAEVFSSACIKLIREPELAAQMGERAWNIFLQRWTWEAIRPRIWAAAEDCLRRGDRALTRHVVPRAEALPANVRTAKELGDA